MDQEFEYIKCAEIKLGQQGPGIVRKVLIDDSGPHEFSRYVRLELARNGSDGGYYLFHVSSDGRGTDTWHSTIWEAFGEAEAEYGVTREDWKDIA